MKNENCESIFPNSEDRKNRSTQVTELPKIRRSIPNLIVTDDIVGVSPMIGPTEETWESIRKLKEELSDQKLAPAGSTYQVDAMPLLYAATALAQLASYSEIVGGISVNRQEIRKWCDVIFDFRNTLPEDENYEKTLILTKEE